MYLLLTWLLSPLAFLRLARAKTPTAQRNILLIQTAKIGDYICSTPIIEALRKSWPTARICLLVAPVTEPLARHQPGIAQVLCYPEAKYAERPGATGFTACSDVSALTQRFASAPIRHFSPCRSSRALHAGRQSCRTSPYAVIAWRHRFSALRSVICKDA